MKKRVVLSILSVGLLLAAFVLVPPAHAQSKMTLMDGGSGGVLFTASDPGAVKFTAGEAQATTNMGVCAPAGCSLSGTASGMVAGIAVTAFTLTSNIPLEHLGPQLVGSALLLQGNDTTAFTGILTALSFIKTDEDHDDGEVAVKATGTVSGGATVALTGILDFGEDAKLQVLNSSGVSQAPEPASMFLLGTGLIGLGSLVRRRCKAA